MNNAHGDRFPFERHEKLDDPERHQRQPPEPAVDALDVAPDHVVVDLGAGTGYFAVPLAKRLGRGKVLALDVEPRMLARLALAAADAGVAERIERLVVDGSPSLPLEGQSVDRALVSSLYHELPDRCGTLAALHRALRIGGRILILDWAPEGTALAGPPPSHRISASRAEQELRGEGFRDVEHLSLYADLWALRAIR